MIHTLISFVEHADEDKEFVAELVQEGTDSMSDIRPDIEYDGASDTQRESLGQCKCTQLKEWLFESLKDIPII